MAELQSNLELNACLEKLTREWDEEAAKMLIKNFKGLRLLENRDVSFSQGNHDELIEGFTKEAGNIQVQKSDNKELREFRQITDGEIVTIGKFEIFRATSKNPNSFSLLFHTAVLWLNFENFEESGFSFYELEYDKISNLPCKLSRHCIRMKILSELSFLQKVKYSIARWFGHQLFFSKDEEEAIYWEK